MLPNTEKIHLIGYNPGPFLSKIMLPTNMHFNQ